MQISKIERILEESAYPGRGMIIGRQENSNTAVIAYFIMGRSENSRNRIFEEMPDGTLKAKAFDETKISDPKLIIYNPVRVLGNVHIVTNGDQTDTIYEYMKEGKCYRKALMTRSFEPDGPIYTPRISGVLNEDGSYMLSILKSNCGLSECLRFYFEYESTPGIGHFIHTYKEDSAIIQSFEGEPHAVEIEDIPIDEWTEKLWTSLNEDNKISLFARYVNLDTHEYESRIINKNK